MRGIPRPRLRSIGGGRGRGLPWRVKRMGGKIARRIPLRGFRFGTRRLR